jgi:1-acyl-sn-glycerol-3-phosphate acyltransferase
MARRDAWTRESWQDLSLDMWRGVEGCRGRLAVSGCGNLAALRSPAVIVANHMSLLETFTIPAVVLPFQHMTFVVKDSLLRVPLFRDVMAGVRPISVKRENPREDFKTLMDEGPAVLAEGRSIVVFPQATRSAVFTPAQFNTLGAKLAKKAGVPLLPMALKTDFHGLGRLVRDFGPVDRSKTVHFAFGAPIEVTGNGREAHEASVDFIACTFAGWGGTVDRGEG